MLKYLMNETGVTLFCKWRQRDLACGKVLQKRRAAQYYLNWVWWTGDVSHVCRNVCDLVWPKIWIRGAVTCQQNQETDFSKCLRKMTILWFKSFGKELMKWVCSCWHWMGEVKFFLSIEETRWVEATQVDVRKELLIDIEREKEV